MSSVLFTAFWVASMVFASPIPSTPLPCAHAVFAPSDTSNSQLAWPNGTLQQLPYHVNALARHGQRMYALAVRKQGATFGDGAHLITIEANGTVTDSGTVGRDLGDAYAGTMVGDRYYVASPGRMYIIDPATRAIVDKKPLTPSTTVGDWDYDPQGGALYGVTSDGQRPARLLRINPTTGDTRVVIDLPGQAAYGAVYLGPNRILYTLRNDAPGRSTWFAIPLTNPATATALGLGPTAKNSDATGCTPAASTTPIPGPAPNPIPVAPTTRATPNPTGSAAPSPSAILSAHGNPPPLLARPGAADPAEPAHATEPRRKQRWVAVTAVAFVAGGMAARRIRAR